MELEAMWMNGFSRIYHIESSKWLWFNFPTIYLWCSTRIQFRTPFIFIISVSYKSYLTSMIMIKLQILSFVYRWSERILPSCFNKYFKFISPVLLFYTPIVCLIPSFHPIGCSLPITFTLKFFGILSLDVCGSH